MAKAIKTEQTTKKETILLDATDISILRRLQQNARMTVKEVADAVHLSTTPVHERIKRLERNGVIKQYTTIIDAVRVNKGLMVIVYVSLKAHSKTAGAKFIKHIHELDEVIECYNISGEFDFMLKVVAENMDDYYNFHVNKLSQSENIGNVQSVFVMGVLKETQVRV
jgi:Lrp/AsnC family transcriptional regulator, leucine-responsive regulatory protein